MKLTLARVFFCACAALATQARAQNVSQWTGNSADGLWSTAGNWNPSGVPTAPNEADIDVNATIALPTTSIGSLFIQSSTVNLTVGGTTFTANNISVDNGATVNLNITGGGSLVSTNNANSNNASTFVGDGNGTGTLNLTGTGSLNFTSGTLGSAVGLGGTGVFNQSGSTTVNATTGGQTGTLIIGADGNASIPSSLPPNSQIATGGIGTYNISQSAVLNADELAIGVGSGLGAGQTTGGSTATTGLLNINGGSVNVTTLVLGTVTLGGGTAVSNVSGSINQTAGTATIGTVAVGAISGAVANYTLSGGTLIVSSDLNIGDADGTTGSMTLSGTGTLTNNGTFEVGGANGTGSFTYAGGTLTTSGIAVGSGGTFNQNTNFTPTMGANPISLINGIYNLNSGTLSIGGDTGAGTSGVSGTGNFNFAGGTVATTSAWNDTLNSTITGISTIDTTVAAATLAGTLTGTGTIGLTGGHILSLTGTGNSGSWGVTVTGSSELDATNVNSLSTNGSYVIGTGSLFKLLGSANAVDTFSGNISDTTDAAGMAFFDVTSLGANELVLAGTTGLDIHSQTNIGSATLEVDNGTISNINGGPMTSTGTLDIGSGSTTGTVQLQGANFIQMVNVNPNSTLFAGNSISGSVTNMGTLGTLGSLNTPATLLIGGTLTSTGRLVINSNGLVADTFGTAAQPLTSANLSGKLLVNGLGTASIPIVFTSGGVTSTLTTNPPTPLFTANVVVVGDNLVLNTVQNFVSSFAQTPNEAAVGGSIDHLIAVGVPFPTAFIPVLTALNGLTAAQIPVALEQLTPQSLQYARNICFENATFLAERMNGVDANLRDGPGGLDTNAISIAAPGFDSGLGRSLGSLVAYNEPPYHTAGPIGNDFYPGDTTASPEPFSPASSKRNLDSSSSGQTMSDSFAHEATYNTGQNEHDWSKVSEFIGGDVILADLNQNQNGTNPSSKAKYTAGDATAGVSFKMTSHLAAGVLFDYNHTDASTDSSGSRTKIDSYAPGMFATYSDHGFYVNGLFSYGYNTYSNSRNIGFRNATATSDPSGQQFITSADAGYDFHPNKSWVVGPTLGLTYTHLDLNSFTETGAPGENLSIQEQNVDSLRSRLGAHAIYQTRVGYVLLQPNVSAIWQHEYLDNDSGITSSFSDYPTTPFTIQPGAVSRDSALLGAGLTTTFDNTISLCLNYSADVNPDDYFAQTVMVGFNARF